MSLYISILTCFQAPWDEKKRNSVHDAVCGNHNCQQNKDFKTVLFFIFSYVCCVVLDGVSRVRKLLKTKRNLLYIRNQSVPRSKHSPEQL
jgi:hypothetical protein